VPTAWVLVALAIVAEVTGTLSMRASDGFTRLWPSLMVVAGYAIAFVLLAQSLKTLGVGPVYAIWAGLGTVGAAIGGFLLFSERLSPLTLVGMVIVIVGVAVMSVGGAGAH
jgi:small multidrug resistance pump